MSRFAINVILGVTLAFGITAGSTGAALGQDAAKGEQKSRSKPPAATSEDAKPGSAAEPKTKKPLTAQQQKMKDCGAKWQEEKKAKGVKGREAWNKFRSQCLKS